MQGRAQICNSPTLIRTLFGQRKQVTRAKLNVVHRSSNCRNSSVAVVALVASSSSSSSSSGVGGGVGGELVAVLVLIVLVKVVAVRNSSI